MLLDRSHDNDEVDNQLYFQAEVANGGTVAAPLSAITVRYWFTNETPTDPLKFECGYAAVNCSNITSRFVTLTTPVAKSNTYLELGFTAAAGSIAPGSNSGEIQTRIHHVNYSNFQTTATCSFIADPSFVYKPSFGRDRLIISRSHRGAGRALRRITRGGLCWPPMCA